MILNNTKYILFTRSMILFVLLTTSTSLFSQSVVTVYSIDCDSINVDNDKYEFVDRLPSPVKSFAEMQNDFLKLVDTSMLNKTIFIEAIIDTSGDVLCPEILGGNSNLADTIALNYISGLKFESAVKDNKNITLKIVIPLYGKGKTETKDYIKTNGKWEAR